MSVAKAVADMFSCTEESPGRFVLAENPDLECYTGQWKSFFFPACVYVGGGAGMGFCLLRPVMPGTFFS